MAHVAHLTSVHTADDIRIFHKECRALEQAGFRVSLVAPDRYHQDKADYGGVELKAVPTPTSQWRLGRMTRTNLQVILKALSLKADVYHIHDPELLPGLWALKATGAKTVYDAHEDIPKAIMSKTWIPRPLRSVVSRISGAAEDLSTLVFDGVVAATRSIGSRFPAGKTLVLQNYPILTEFKPDHSLEQYLQRERCFIYHGMRGRVRGIKQMIDAMEFVPGGRLRLFGSKMEPDLRQDAERSQGWSSVDYGGWASREALCLHFSQVRAGLVTFLPEPNHVEAGPNKLFEYMSAGLPLIVSDFPVWREVIDEVGCGRMVDPNDPREIAEAMNWLLKRPEEAFEMGQRARKAVEDRFNWAVESRKLIEFYQELVA